MSTYTHIHTYLLPKYTLWCLKLKAINTFIFRHPWVLSIGERKFRLKIKSKFQLFTSAAFKKPQTFKAYIHPLNFQFYEDKSINLNIIQNILIIWYIYIYKYTYRVRHLTFLFSTSTYFVNCNTQLMSDLTDNYA